MKNLVIAGAVATVAVAAGVLCAGDDQWQPAAATKEHQLLTQFVGEWESEATMPGEPGQPAITCKGFEKVRTLGNLWVVSDMQGDMPDGSKMSAMMTVGFDPAKKKYVGTWIDSATPSMWVYSGDVDPTGKIFTLNTEGPNMDGSPGTSKYKDVTEFKDADHRLLTSSVQNADGTWATVVTATYTRKK